jgi:hypothetical protein
VLGHGAEAIKLASIVKSRLGTGEKFPGNIRQRADALVARIGSGTEATTPAAK